MNDIYTIICNGTPVDRVQGFAAAQMALAALETVEEIRLLGMDRMLRAEERRYYAMVQRLRTDPPARGITRKDRPMATDPNIFNEPIRDVCTAVNAINRDLVHLPSRDVGTAVHYDLMAKRDRLNRHLDALYRRQDAALFAQWSAEPGTAGER